MTKRLDVVVQGGVLRGAFGEHASLLLVLFSSFPRPSLEASLFIIGQRSVGLRFGRDLAFRAKRKPTLRCASRLYEKLFWANPSRIHLLKCATTVNILSSHRSVLLGRPRSVSQPVGGLQKC